MLDKDWTMKKITSNRFHTLLLGIGLVAIAFGSGCQAHMAGQNLPSPWYLNDDVQYFAPGPEMKLAREAAVMKEYAAQRELDQIQN